MPLSVTTRSTLVGNDKRIVSEAMLSADRMLTVSTYKNFSGELVTRACISHRMTGKNCENIFSTMLGGDYNRELARIKCRMTAKVVEAQHNIHLGQIEAIAVNALKYYGVTMVEVSA